MVFGLFNGLFVLPVVLSLIGPTSYKSSQDTEDKQPGEEAEPLKPIIKKNAEEPAELSKV